MTTTPSPSFSAAGAGGGKVFPLLCLLLLWASTTLGQSRPLYVGADVSFLPQTEQNGGTFRDGHGDRDALSILHDNGFTLFRLRIWHNPPDGTNGLNYTLALARRIHAIGGSILLDFHYSDSWADPGQQHTPLAWRNLSVTQRADSVEAYTEHVLRALAAQGTLPIAVQIGNEITAGLLWPEGRVGGSANEGTQWANLRLYLQRGARAVRRVQPADSPIAIVLHIDRGGSWADTQWWFDTLGTTVDYDWIGLSYYPWWHGSWANFLNTIEQASQRYGKGILIAETAYPWTTRWHDSTHNLVGDGSPLLPEFPASPEGQRGFLHAMHEAVATLPNGVGWVYWAPEWISAPTFGSAWENLALFDFAGTWMHTGGITTTSATPPLLPSPPGEVSLWPHPVQDEVQIECPQFASETPTSHVSIHDMLGRRVLDVALTSPRIRVSTSGWAQGVYLALCEGEGRSPSRTFMVVR